MMVLRTLSHGAVMGLISPREYIDLVTLNRDTEENVYFSYCMWCSARLTHYATYIRTTTVELKGLSKGYYNTYNSCQRVLPIEEEVSSWFTLVVMLLSE